MLADGEVVGEGPVALGVGRAVVSTDGLVPGTHELTVRYSGDVRFAPGEGTVTLEVRPNPTGGR